MSNLRIGFGFDSHQIVKGDSMTLGGIEISSGYQIIAHSDGDVVTHATVSYTHLTLPTTPYV